MTKEDWRVRLLSEGARVGGSVATGAVKVALRGRRGWHTRDGVRLCGWWAKTPTGWRWLGATARSVCVESLRVGQLTLEVLP